MPINRVDQAAALGHRDIVKELANACISRFADVRGVGAGIGNGSCCASVKLAAVAADPEQQFRYGSSQAHLLDPNVPYVHGQVFNPVNHAERRAVDAGILGGGYLPHLFVELEPCDGGNGCRTWAATTIPGIHIWYLYDSTPAMGAAHLAGTAAQYAVLNGLLP